MPALIPKGATNASADDTLTGSAVTYGYFGAPGGSFDLYRVASDGSEVPLGIQVSSSRPTVNVTATGTVRWKRTGGYDCGLDKN